MEPNDMIKPEHATIADRYAGEECKLYTLGGIKDATISGRLCRFAIIRTMDNCGQATFSWEAVERIMQQDEKLFYIC